MRIGQHCSIHKEVKLLCYNCLKRTCGNKMIAILWNQFILVIFVSGMLVLLEAALAECPPNPLEKVRDCTADILPELNAQAQTSGPEAYKERVQVLQVGCTQSKLRNAANCIDELMSQCKGTTDEEQMLHRLVNKEKTMGTVDYFCEHLGVYERHASCISNHHNDTWACSKDAQKSFQTKMRAGASMDVLIMGSCRFHAVARDCLTATSKTHCGTESSVFVKTILTGLMPPYCDAINPEYQSGDSTGSNKPGDTTERWARGETGNSVEGGTSATSTLSPSSVKSLSVVVISLVLCIQCFLT